MKTKYFCSLILLSFIIFSCHPFKRIELREALTSSKNTLETQFVRFKHLESKNDIFFSTGSYVSDSVYHYFNIDIKSQQLKIDSSVVALNNIIEQVNNNKSFAREFKTIKKNTNIVNESATMQYWFWNNQYIAIENKMLAADISGEKGKMSSILNKATEKQEQAKEKIRVINRAKHNLQLSGNISEAISKKYDARLAVYLTEIDSITNEIMILQRKIDHPSDFGTSLLGIKTKVLLIDSVVNEKAAYQEFIFSMIEDGLSKSKRNLFNLAAFFGSGGYTIPAQKYNIAKEYFAPLVDSILKFSNSYSDILRTAQVVVNGYADGTEIQPGTPLYLKTKDYLKKENPSKEELNVTLSVLRAEEISKLLNGLIRERANDFTSVNKIIFEISEAGEGEELPDQNIKDYKANDERRRIVLIYWGVLPVK